MGYFGRYFGGGSSSSEEDDEVVVSPPIPAPTVVDDQTIHSHAEHAVDRLCQFARQKGAT